MKLQNRIQLLQQLKKYLLEDGEELVEVKTKASQQNGWFTIEFIEMSINSIINNFLDHEKLVKWVELYQINESFEPKNVGIVMAGNIPLVGFHDFLCVFICGHYQTIKLSGKDDLLLKHLVQKMYSWEVTLQNYVAFANRLSGCDAYIATGSNNSGNYFDYYFSKYPSIIRRNRTSVAILNGEESKEQLEKLSVDIHSYFGLGCRNVTKIYVPEGYDFVPLLQSFDAYSYFADHHKYKNNYDYNLTIQIMNNRFYMTNGSTLMVENESNFSPISQLNYSFYKDIEVVKNELRSNKDLQCIVGDSVDFGMAQNPALINYADGVDTMQFLLNL